MTGGRGGCAGGVGVTVCDRVSSSHRSESVYELHKGAPIPLQGLQCCQLQQTGVQGELYEMKASTGSRGNSCNLQPFYCAFLGVTATTSGLEDVTVVGAAVAGCLGASAVRFLNVACILHAAFCRSGSARSISAMSCSGVLGPLVLAEGFAFEDPPVCEGH